MAWEQLSTEVVHKNPWTEYRHDTYRLPNGEVGNYYYLETPGAVVVVAIDVDGKILMHRQHRYLFGESSLEFPGGGIKFGQTTEQAAQVELAQEVGRQAKVLTQVGRIAPMNALIKEWQHVFVASDLSHVDAQLDETEEFERLSLTPTEIDEAIASGEMWDGFCMATWALAKPHVLEILEQQNRRK